MSHAAENIRTFIALPLPPDWIESLGGVTHQLAARVPAGVRWVDPTGMHLTLRFLGNTDTAQVPGIIAALRRELAGVIAPDLALSGLGTFPPRGNPRVIWAGVSGQLDHLTNLQRGAESAVTSLGWPAEQRPFRPHLTLGRIRNRASDAQRRAVLDAIAEIEVPGCSTWRPDLVRLYQSVLTPQGPIYSGLGDIALSQLF